MAKVLLNALASTAGGGRTYLRNVLPRLAQDDLAQQYVALVPAAELAAYQAFSSERLRIEAPLPKESTLPRWWWEQTGLRALLKERRVDVLLSLGNFVLFGAPVPQILFNRNALYFSPWFARDLRRRGHYAALAAHGVKSRLARLSIKQADLNLTPSTAFAELLRTQRGLNTTAFATLPFGFDAELFTRAETPLNEQQLAKLNTDVRCLRLLYVSHYNYFRNFETLLRAWPLLKAETGAPVQLVLTTDIKRGAVYGGYDATAAAELIDRLGVRNDIAMLGAVDYGKLHQLYRMCDVFVCPSYAESFGHPLVEAMASGLPVVAADLPVHREVCGAAANYFAVFDEQALAQACARVLKDEALRTRLRAQGVEQAQRFSWDAHVAALVQLIERCLADQKQ